MVQNLLDDVLMDAITTNSTNATTTAIIANADDAALVVLLIMAVELLLAVSLCCVAKALVAPFYEEELGLDDSDVDNNNNNMLTRMIAMEHAMHPTSNDESLPSLLRQQEHQKHLICKHRRMGSNGSSITSNSNNSTPSLGTSWVSDDDDVFYDDNKGCNFYADDTATITTGTKYGRKQNATKQGTKHHGNSKKQQYQACKVAVVSFDDTAARPKVYHDKFSIEDRKVLYYTKLDLAKIQQDIAQTIYTFKERCAGHPWCLNKRKYCLRGLEKQLAKQCNGLLSTRILLSSWMPTSSSNRGERQDDWYKNLVSLHLCGSDKKDPSYGINGNHKEKENNSNNSLQQMILQRQEEQQRFLRATTKAGGGRQQQPRLLNHKNIQNANYIQLHLLSTEYSQHDKLFAQKLAKQDRKDANNIYDADAKRMNRFNNIIIMNPRATKMMSKTG